MSKTRKEIVDEGERLVREIDMLFADAFHVGVAIDPNGQLGRMRSGISAMLENEARTDCQRVEVA